MLNLNQFFAAIGRIGRTLLLINQSQSQQPTPFSELSGFSYISSNWLTQLTSTYDQNIRAQSNAMSTWITSANNILTGMVSAAAPAQGRTVPLAIQYVYNQMVAQGATIQKFTIGSAVTPGAGNHGQGNLVAVLTRSDGIPFQLVIPEAGTVTITADSFTGGAPLGREPWQYNGQPNTSSLGTANLNANVLNWDYPQGSGAIATGTSVTATDYGNSSGNFLTNGDFANWAGVPPAPNNWNLVAGAWGVDVQQNNSNQLGGAFCVQFNPGTGVHTELTQQFDNNSTTTGATAGTPVATSSFTGFVGNIWILANGAIGAGALTVSLVGSSGIILLDQQGNPNTLVISLVGLSAVAYTPFAFAFRTPTQLPADGIVRLDIKMSTPLVGSAVFLDWVTFTQPPSALYLGGPALVMFSNPKFPFVAAPTPDSFTVTFTNNWGGSSFLASFQSLVFRIWGFSQMILPNAAAPTISDALITAV